MLILHWRSDISIALNVP